MALGKLSSHMQKEKKKGGKKAQNTHKLIQSWLKTRASKIHWGKHRQNSTGYGLQGCFQWFDSIGSYIYSIKQK